MRPLGSGAEVEGLGVTTLLEVPTGVDWPECSLDLTWLFLLRELLGGSSPRSFTYMLPEDPNWELSFSFERSAGLAVLGRVPGRGAAK